MHLRYLNAQSPGHYNIMRIAKEFTSVIFRPKILATAHASDSCLMPDYVRIINFLLLLLIIIQC